MTKFDAFIAECENEALQQEVEDATIVCRNGFIALLTLFLASIVN